MGNHYNKEEANRHYLQYVGRKQIVTKISNKMDTGNKMAMKMVNRQYAGNNWAFLTISKHQIGNTYNRQTTCGQSLQQTDNSNNVSIRK